MDLISSSEQHCNSDEILVVHEEAAGKILFATNQVRNNFIYLLMDCKLHIFDPV